MSPDRCRRTTYLAATIWCIVLATVGCAVADDAPRQPEAQRPEAQQPEAQHSMQSEPFDPLLRVVRIVTTACGDASRTTGTGVLIGDGRVVTAAHVVVGADEVHLETGTGGSAVGTRIAVLDTVRDLAILSPEPDSRPPVPPLELTDVDSGDRVVMAGLVRDVSGSTAVTPALTTVSVVRPVVMTVDEVRGSGRVRRSGYELSAEILGGDSGSGVFDERGRLAAIVFAEPTARDAIAFAVAADEIRPVLSAPEAPYACDPNRSRVMPVLPDPLDPHLPDPETSS